MPILKVENLKKEFENGSEILIVLDNINFEIEKGDSVSITGPSGSGKSTLMGILAGLEAPTEGRVTLLNQNLADLKERELARLWGSRVGFIFQSYRLLPSLTAIENVRVPLELSGISNDAEPKAREWLEKVGLADRIHHLPSQLSGGEQQRVALARALATGPDILFADEPTGNLDSKTGRQMADLLFSLVEGQKTTLLLITHEVSLAARTRRTIALEGGKILKISQQ